MVVPWKIQEDIITQNIVMSRDLLAMEQPKADDCLLRKRDIGMATQIAIGSTTLSLGTIVGIAVGGAVSLFLALATVAIIQVRKRHRREKVRISEVDEGGNVEVDLKQALRSTRPPEICPSRRLSLNPFLPLDEDMACHEWMARIPSENPPMAKVKRFSSQKALFRRSGIRESWPLVSNIPLALLPSQPTINIRAVAPPGYIVQEPRRATRMSSKRKSSTAGSISDIQYESGGNLDPPPKRTTRYRSMSETQLTTILRSTSQRLKGKSHRRSLTRTLTTLGRDPGLPPKDRLPTPPLRKAAESQEVLIDKSTSQSVASFAQSSHFSRSPSPAKHSRIRSNHQLPRHVKSPAPSAESPDSLCGRRTPEVAIPAALTSPSKSLKGERRHKTTLSSGTQDISAIIHDDGRSSIIGPASLDEDHNPLRISLTSGPFISSVKSCKPVIPKPQIEGLKPMYFRKATFGHEATPDRPESCCSPLRDVSGNVQFPVQEMSSRNLSTGSPEHNPFQWSPQAAMRTRSTSPKRSRRKGHKRSNVVRVSGLSIPSRPPSTVEVVKEESEEESPLKFNLPSAATIRIVEPLKSPSRASSASSHRRLGSKPPSAASFNPSLSAPSTSRSEDNSPTLGIDETKSIPYSPTLSVCNYYTESGGASEEEFFKSKKVYASTLKARRHGRNYSTDLSSYPSHQAQKELQDKLVSFLPLSLSDSPTPILTPSPARPLPSITSTMTGLHSPPGILAPPLLTIPVPPHLMGPRSEPSKVYRSNRSPPRESLPAAILSLRRQNSEVSHTSNEESPIMPLKYPQKESNISEQPERGRSRGSKNYLSLGQTGPIRTRDLAQPRQVTEKRDSHRVYQDRKKRKNEQVSPEKELTPVREVSSPINALGTIAFKFPALSHSGTSGPTPPHPPKATPIHISDFQNEVLDQENISSVASIPTKGERWSDAMTKPVMNVVRRESKMQHPSPRTPPKWTLSALGTAGQRLMGKEESDTPVRPDSLGLYDQDGFLRSSPEREAREKRKLEREAKRISGFMM